MATKKRSHTKKSAVPAARKQAEKPEAEIRRTPIHPAVAQGGAVFATDLTAELRRRGLADDAIVFALTTEARRLCDAARTLLKDEPDDETLSPRQSKLARRIVELAEQSFETGDEVPGEAPGVVVLREALRSAKDDLCLLAAAQRQLENNHIASQAFTRAEYRIDLALALYEFRAASAAKPEQLAVEAASQERAEIRQQLDAGGAS